jgi:hypothetical protein
MANSAVMSAIRHEFILRFYDNQGKLFLKPFSKTAETAAHVASG